MTGGQTRHREGNMTYEQIQTELNAAQARDPRKAPFGVFTRDPWPAGIGMFFWYSTPEERLAALLDLHPFLEGEGDIAEDRAEWSDARGRLEAVLAPCPEWDTEVAAQVQPITSKRFDLDWIGTFDDLRSDQSELAIDVRERLRGGDGEDTDTPIADDEVEAFAEAVREYGF